jgi:hypothetical protein
MSAMQSPARPELPGVSLPVDMSLGESAIRPTRLKNDWSPSDRPSQGKRALLIFARFLVTFYIGVGAASACQFYGEKVREKIASSFPQLDWFAPRTAPVAQSTPEVKAQPEAAGPSPDQQQLNSMSLDLDAVRQSVDRIASSQDQITRRVEQLAADQEQMTREITRLQTVTQYLLYKSSEPPPRPAPAPNPHSAAAAGTDGTLTAPRGWPHRSDRCTVRFWQPAPVAIGMIFANVSVIRPLALVVEGTSCVQCVERPIALRGLTR